MDKCDLISRLPSDLLISILSHLTFKEAMATSVLSRHWEEMWTFYHGNLDFEVSNELQQKGCSNYARSVNKVMDRLELLESGGMLDSFTIRFNLCPDNYRSVDRWVHFGLMKRRVKRLIFAHNLHFRPSGCFHYLPDYDFPPLQCFNHQQGNIQALTSIRFQRVNVSGEIIEQFLSNCPLLQNLDLIEIESREQLIHLRVSGETLALRHLVICECEDLATVEVSAPNLVSLRYRSGGKRKTKFHVQNVQKLVEFTIGDLSAPRVTALALPLLSYFSYVQMLGLEIYTTKKPGNLTKFTEITSVKHLTMNFVGSSGGAILAWTPLLKAFPHLQKFTVNMQSRCEKKIKGMADCFEKIPNKYLKVFEFIGFGYSICDIKLVTHFLKIIATLEEVLLLCNGGCPRSTFLKSFVWRALLYAEELKLVIPKKVKLVISTPSCSAEG